MRVFWLILALLIGAGAALWILEAPANSPATPTLNATVEPAPEPPPAPAHDLPPALQVPSPLNAPSVRIEERFEIAGRGTHDDPYRISWPLLASAQETIDAEHNKLDAPHWIVPLDGSWVELAGYLAPSTALTETRELLVTMNKWDGCCIGLPPTPFDSLEVKLMEPVEFQGKHLIRFGIVRGQLRIEPFAVGGFLIGLFRLDNATITTQRQ
jgi:hypothetical protein